MIYNLYKNPGWTSFDLVKKIRYITGEKKVGHGGTLDPFAEGVLIIATGKDTKELQQISASDKTYEAVLCLGSKTDTLDRAGEVCDSAPVPKLEHQKILDIFQSFIGEQEQVPPMFSAKKVNGVRLYKLARKNISIPREPARITIHSLELEEFTQPTIRFTVTCSKGTYIRVLGSDIAKKLGTVGHLTKLTRTRVGDYRLQDSMSLEKFEHSWSSTAA